MTRKNKAIQLKMEKSVAFMKEADILFNNKFYNTLVSRLYYSCFHATKALLLTKGIVSKTHSGTALQLNNVFVKENGFDAKHAAFFKMLMNERIESDYDDFIIYDESEVVDFIEPAKRYVEYISILIEKFLERNSENDEPKNTDFTSKH